MTNDAVPRPVGPEPTAGDVTDPARLLGWLRSHLETQVGFIAEFEGGKRIVRWVDTGPGGEPLDVGDALPIDDSYASLLVEHRLAYAVVADTQADPRTAKLGSTSDRGMRSFVGAPIVFSDGTTWGMVGCFGRDPDPSLRDRDGRAALVIAQLIGASLEQHTRSSRIDQERAERVEFALTGANLQIAFQPIVDLHSGSVVGAEALSRFRSDPYRPPNEWFADAASVGLGVELEVAAARAALTHLVELPSKTYLSVNFSPAAVRFVAHSDLFEGVETDRVVLELTEHEEIADYEAFLQALSSLRARGCRIAVDDAGSGFSSLRHILRISPDIIKLDISLTRDIDADPVRRALASSLTNFARATGSRIVAEGIETPAELAALTSLGIRYGQGYFLGKPGELPLPVFVHAVDETAPHVATDREGTRLLAERLLATFEGSSVGLAVITADGVLLHANPALCAILGRPEADVVASGWRRLIHPEDFETGVELVQQLIVGSRDHLYVHTRAARPDGSLVPIAVSATPVRDQQARMQFFLATVRLDAGPPVTD